MRRDGYSYNAISKKIGISKSTLHYWLVDIPYVPNDETIKRIGLARARSREAISKKKQASIAKAKKQAQEDIGTLSKRDFFMLGLALYIGEGKKAYTTGVVNADPRIIRLAIFWFMAFFEVPRENFTLAIHLYPDNNIEETLNFWSRETNIPRTQFRKTQVDTRKGKKMAKRGKLRYGTAHMTVLGMGNSEHGIFLQRRVKSQMDLVLDTAGLV